MYNDPNQSNPDQPQQPPYNPNQSYPPPYNPMQAGQPYQQPYPPFMPPPPPKKSHTVRNLGIGCGSLIVLLALCGIIATVVTNGSHATPNTGATVAKSQSTTAATTAPTTAAAPAKHFKVGDVVKVGDTWEVTVNSVKTSPGGQYDSPKGIYVLLDVTAKNVSSKEQDISSILDFKLADSTGVSYTETFSTLDLPSPPDGKVEAGAPSRGTFIYDVPKDMKSFTFAFAPDFLADGQTIWDITD